MRSLISSLSAVGVVSVLASNASATVLTFDFNGSNTDSVPSSYGNRVSSFAPGFFNYGSDGGITPNVSVIYTPVLKLGGAQPPDNTRVFGDLQNVLYRDPVSYTHLQFVGFCQFVYRQRIFQMPSPATASRSSTSKPNPSSPGSSRV